MGCFKQLVYLCLQFGHFAGPQFEKLLVLVHLQVGFPLFFKWQQLVSDHGGHLLFKVLFSGGQPSTQDANLLLLFPVDVCLRNNCLF